jgi:hypothetical protein
VTDVHPVFDIPNHGPGPEVDGEDGNTLWLLETGRLETVRASHEFLRVWWDCMVFLTYDRTHVVADLREEMPAKMDV